MTDNTTAVTDFLNSYNAGERDFEEINLTGADLYGADLYGADLTRADLTGANLTGANLTGANLTGANLLGCGALYSVYAPFMSSRHDTLRAGAFERGGEIVLLFTTGCKVDKTASEMRLLVSETHVGTPHEVQYLAAIAFIEACYFSDLRDGRFEIRKEETLS